MRLLRALLARERWQSFCAVMRIQDGFPPPESYIHKPKHRVHSTYIFPRFILVHTRFGFNTTLKCIPPAQGVRLKSITLQPHQINKDGADYCAPPYGASVRAGDAPQHLRQSTGRLDSIIMCICSSYTRIVAGRMKLTFFLWRESYCTCRRAANLNHNAGGNFLNSFSRY